MDAPSGEYSWQRELRAIHIRLVLTRRQGRVAHGVANSQAVTRGNVVFLALEVKSFRFSRRRRQQRQMAPMTKTAPAAPKRYTTTCISWERNMKNS